MQEQRDIAVSYGRTFNLGNYESERIDAFISRDLEDGEDREVAILDEIDDLKKIIENYKEK